MEDLTQSLDSVCLGEEVSEKIHLGSNVYASVQSPYRGVNLRQWFKDSKNVKRPGNGIILSPPIWQNLLNEDAKVDSRLPELKHTERCYEQSDHQNGMGWMLCSECNPDTCHEPWY
jgi:hypothetical protein